MNAVSPIFDVTVENFESDVILASDTTLIVLDFWAEWCGPCKTLTPILEKLAKEYAGRFRLAKVNTEEQQEIASMFGIRSIPTVIALKGQKPVSAFQGAQPEARVREFLDKFLPSAGEEKLAKAKEKLDSGDIEGAIDELKVALALTPSMDAARLMLADIAMRDNRIEEAKQYLAQCKPTTKLDEDYQRVASKIEAAEQAGNSPEANALRAQIASDPTDHEARLQLAAVLVVESQFEPAFQTLLESVQLDRNWNEQAARKKLIEYFALAKEQPELVRRFRQALAATLN
ncbi:MAG: thioredoxin [Burkholderiales bacterium]|nr:MAG: thioredoxin [Burkholderiales bacterium]TAG80453.1 MAG: thioredoxin [Betaproteobacteria bacterium]